MIGNSDHNTNFPHEVLLTNRQMTNICKALLITYQQILNCQKLNYKK